MALNRNRILTADAFTGAGKVHSKETAGLSDVVREIVIKQAATRISVENITALTDSSAGTASGDIELVVIPLEVNVDGLTTGVDFATVDASVDDIMDAYAVILEQANLVLSELGLGSVGEGPGTIAMSGTIAAVDILVDPNDDDDDSWDYTNAKTIFTELLDRQATVIKTVDIMLEAVGLPVNGQDAGAGFAQGTVLHSGTIGSPSGFSSVDIGTTAMTNATTVTGGTISTVTEVAVELALAIFANNIAELADQVDLVTNVVATTELNYVAGS